MTSTIRFYTGIVAALSMLSMAPTFGQETGDAASIKKLVFTEKEAVEAHDVGKVMSVYWHSKNLLVFDAVPGQFVGWDAVKEDYENYFKAFPGKTESTYGDVHAYAFGDTGYAVSTQNWKFSRPEGKPLTFTQRVTDIYRKIHGHWLCIHEHASVPVNLLSSD